MLKKGVMTVASLGASIAAGSVHASCGSSPSPGERNKGNYLCEYCDPIDAGVAGNAAMFIRSEVNQHVSQWRRGDTVNITNGDLWRTFYYNHGNWVQTAGGTGVGPGEPRNHDGDGKSCDEVERERNQASSTSGSSRYGSGGYSYPGQSDPLSGYWSNYDMGTIPEEEVRRGTVYVEEMPPEASNWSDYYSNLYSGSSQCSYC